MNYRKPLRRVKKRNSFIFNAVATFLIVIIPLVVAITSVQNFKKLNTSRDVSANGSGIKPLKSVIIYGHPEWRDTTVKLTNEELAQRFSYLVYARDKMKTSLNLYKINTPTPYTGESYIYLTAMDRIAAPNSDYVTPSQQLTPCAESDRTFKPYSDNVNMDAGDFCEIQDSIVSGTCLLEYPDICPTENFYIHKQNGDRFSKSSGSGSSYKPNPADSQYRKYMNKRAVREMVGGNEVDYLGNVTAHPATGATGIFLDNVELSWSKVLKDGGSDANAVPREFADSAAYASAVAGLVDSMHTVLHDSSLGYNFPLWGNMISNPNNATSWNRYITDDSLEGGMMEDFVLDWGRGPHSSNTTQAQLTQATTWVNSGKHFMAAAPGNLWREQNGEIGSLVKDLRYSLANFLLITNGTNSSYRFSDDYGDINGSRTMRYREYFEQEPINEYNYELGLPLGARQQISSSPLVYRRLYECGTVEVNFTTAEGSITYDSLCPNATPTPSASSSPSSSPSATPSASPSTSPSACAVADIDQDQGRDIDVADYNLLVGTLFSIPNPLRADIVADGNVDILDYSYLSTCYGQTY